MEMCKVFLIVCFTISSLGIRESQSRGINDVEQLELAPKVGSQKCACFPETDSGVRASDYIYPDFNEQERLVVYFYKAVKSHNFTVYIPNAEKQRIFPDLLIEGGDVVEKFLTGTYFDLFKIEKKYFQTVFSKFSDKNTVRPLNVTYFSEKDLPINNQLKGDGFDLPGDTNQFSFSNTNSSGQSTLQITQSNQKINAPTEYIQRPVTEITNLYNNLPFLPIPIISGTNPSQKPHQPLENQQQSIESTSISPKDLSSAPSPNISSQISQIPREKINLQLEIQRPSKSKALSPEVIKSKDKLNTLVTQTLEHKNLSTAPNEEGQGEKYYIKQISPENIDVSTAELMNFVNPGWIDIRLPTNTYQDTSFEKWFIHQIQNVRSNRPSMSNLLDFHTLKFLLKKALYDNGIRVTNKGQLYDSNGNIVDMTKLKLRPILLGNPLDYEKLIASKKCVIPYDIPYLEALLVTLVYPPKVLAIIPLRKILISKDSKNTILTEPDKLLNDKPECVTKKCLHQKIKNFEGNKMTENEVPKHYNLAMSSKTEEEHKQVLAKTSNDITNDISNSGVKISDAGLENEYSLAHSHALGHEEDYSKYNTFIDDENDFEIKVPLGQNPTEDIDVHQEIANKPKDEDYDMIGYRIVGGNPATSSGTPVSNRGRSGDGGGKVIHKRIRFGR